MNFCGSSWPNHWSGVNFINVLSTAFTHVDPECTKRQSSQQCHLALLGPTSIKAARKTLVKLSPGGCNGFVCTIEFEPGSWPMWGRTIFAVIKPISPPSGHVVGTRRCHLLPTEIALRWKF